MKNIGILLVAIMMFPAHAQVNKCVNPKTKVVTYSDTLCDTTQKSTFIEGRKSDEELRRIQMQADEANERKYRSTLNEMQSQQLSQPGIPSQQTSTDKSNSYECRLAQKNHETTASSATNSRNIINASTMKVNAACGLKTEMMQEPPRKSQLKNQTNNPTMITHCDNGFCYDNLGGVYHRNGPTFMTGPNGQTCHGDGTVWNCN